MSRIAERVTRNAAYSLAGSVMAFVAGIVSSVTLARLLGPRDLGTYTLVLWAGGVLGMLVVLGLPHAVAKYVAEYDARGERETAGRVLAALARLTGALALAVGAAAIVMAPLLERAFDAPGFTTAFRIAAVGLTPAALAGLAMAGLQGLQEYGRVTGISMAGTVLLLSTTLGLLAAGAGVPGAIAALSLTAAFTSLAGWKALRGHLHLSLRRSRLPGTARAKLRRYVPTVSAVLLLDAVVWQRSEVFFLGLFRSSREVAWYGVAYAGAWTVMRLLPRSVSLVLPPVASGLYGTDDRAGLQTLFRTGSRYLAVLAFPVVVGGAVLARPLLTTLYGAPYGPAAVAFPLVLVGAGAGAVGSVTASIQSGIERQDLILKVAVPATIANVVLDLALIPRWGVVGAAIANALAQAGAVVTGIVVTSRVLGVRFPSGDCLRILAAALATGAAAYVVAHAVDGTVGLGAGVLAGAAAYPVALLATGAVRMEDVDRLRGVRQLVPHRLRGGYGGLLRLAARWAA